MEAVAAKFKKTDDDKKAFYKTRPSVVTLEMQKQIPYYPSGVMRKSDPTEVGMATRPMINAWLHDSRLITMGQCEHAPDMEDRQFQFGDDYRCDCFYCAKGSLWVVWDDGEGNKGDLRASVGEHIWMPGGKYKYTLKGTEEQSTNVFASISGAAPSEESLNNYYKGLEERFPGYIAKMEAVAAKFKK
jgi:hypothetical protein